MSTPSKFPVWSRAMVIACAMHDNELYKTDLCDCRIKGSVVIVLDHDYYNTRWTVVTSKGSFAPFQLLKVTDETESRR